MMDESQLVDETGEIRPEVKAQAEALIGKIAELCKDEEPAVVLFVLEAALTEQINMFAPPLGDLFTSMMRAYKQKAAALLHMLELLKSGGVSISDLMNAGDAETPQTEEPSESI